MCEILAFSHPASLKIAQRLTSAVSVAGATVKLPLLDPQLSHPRDATSSASAAALAAKMKYAGGKNSVKRRAIKSDRTNIIPMIARAKARPVVTIAAS